MLTEKESEIQNNSNNENNEKRRIESHLKYNGNKTEGMKYETTKREKNRLAFAAQIQSDRKEMTRSKTRAISLVYRLQLLCA